MEMKSSATSPQKLVAYFIACLVPSLAGPGAGVLSQTTAPTTPWPPTQPDKAGDENRRADGRHPDFEKLPRITRTHRGLPGDPLNVAVAATQDQLIRAMLKADWLPADPTTLRSSLRIVADTVFRRPYPTAPVSNLYLWQRKEDLAFEQPVGKGPRRRHHVRFWKSLEVAEDGRPLWVGSATLDTRVELSRRTGLITHRIGPAVDLERDKLLEDLRRAGEVERLAWIDGFQEKLRGRNGGGDRYYTDGRLAVGVLVRTDP
jgi:hypothetical protein